jgi:hypothetical protein
MTLTEFLAARLDEDQAAAEAWSAPFSNPTAEQREHIARHDPAWVLAEVEAKRADHHAAQEREEVEHADLRG